METGAHSWERATPLCPCNGSFIDQYLLILFFPLVGSILTGCFGRHIGEKGAGILTSCCLIIGLSYSVLVGIEILFNSTATFLRL